MPLWVSDLSEKFWAAAGESETFPRNLRRPIAYALPVSLVLLPRLRLRSADTWLARQGIPCSLSLSDRGLRACLIARNGSGFIFIDGVDPDDEQRYSVAHELAHFLRDYWQPRQVAVERLGPGVLAVLDGERAARQDERVQALLANAPLGFHTHLMDRTAEGRYTDATTDRAERSADLLAFELLAPSEAVLGEVTMLTGARSLATIVHTLNERFGIPLAQSKRYAAILSPHPPPVDPLLSRLGIVPRNVELFEIDGK